MRSSPLPVLVASFALAALGIVTACGGPEKAPLTPDDHMPLPAATDTPAATPPADDKGAASTPPPDDKSATAVPAEKAPAATPAAPTPTEKPAAAAPKKAAPAVGKQPAGKKK